MWGTEKLIQENAMSRRLGALVSLFVVLLCMAMPGAAAAQTATGSSAPPSREQVLKLMSAMGIQQAVDASLQQTQVRVKDAARESFLKQNPGADEATLKKLDNIFDTTPFFKFDDIVEAIVPVYQKNLSAGDVQAGIDFYTSEPGKRLLAKVPTILHESDEEGGKLVQEKMEAYTGELERKLGAFQNELHPQPAPVPQPEAGSGAGKTTDEKSK
jgi:hypothetical protein